MWLLMPDVSCGKNVAEEYWWEALQSSLMPCHHSRIVLPSVNQNVPKRVRPLVFKPMQHIVCTKGLQDNLLMGNRGWGLRILSSSIWENCWLLFYTHTLPSFFLPLAHIQSHCTESAMYFCLKVLQRIWLHMTSDFLGAPWFVSLSQGRTTTQRTSRAEHSHSWKKAQSVSHYYKHLLIGHFF